MDRSSQRRIWKVENLLAAEKKEREEKRRKEFENYVLHARFHATAVAAIVLSGEPKIDEPLIRPWTRALQHYGISALQQYGMNLDDAARERDQVAAAQRLFPIIVGGAEESAKFAEIFRTAPGWLFYFTNTLMDALWLKLLYPLWLKSDLPHKSWRPKWGSAGYEESRRWPLLPLGTMTHGDPISDEDARLWPFPLDRMKEADPTPDFDDNLSQEDEDEASAYEFLENLNLLLDLAEKPEKEKELSRYQKLRLRKHFERYQRNE
jgi:hypothetical protein